MGLFDYWRNLLSRPPQNQYEAQHLLEIQGLINEEYMTPKVPYPTRIRNTALPLKSVEWYHTKEGRRWSLARNPEFQKLHPAPEFDAYGNPLNIQAKQDYWDKVAGSIRGKNLDKAELAAARYNALPTKGFFPIAESVLTPNYLHSYNTAGDRSIGPRPFVSLDIETDDRHRPISISALKFVYDAKTGKFHSAGSYQRFYETEKSDVRDTYSVHGLTPEILKKLRQQQGANYSTRYFTDPREEQALREFIGSSTIVGQNIVNFDLPVLFHGDTLQNNVIDTVIAARNVWADRPNGLDDIFKRVMGRTMEEAGLSHHDANADTLATMMILEKMVKWKGPTGDAIRYVMNHQGVQLAPINKMLENPRWEEDKVGQVIEGTYQDINRGDDIGDLYMSARKIKVRRKEDYVLSQSDINDMVDPTTLTDEELLGSSAAEIGAGAVGVPGTIEDLKAAYNSFSFWRKSKIIRDAAHARSTDEAWAIIGSAFNTEGPEAKSIMAQAISSKRAEALEDIKELRKKGHRVSKEDERIIRTSKSLSELADALDEITNKSREWGNILNTISQIKPYDINQLVDAAKGQWGGITGAASGVVPKFILNPVSRLGNAAFNAVDARLSPWNALQRTWNSGVGNVVTGALTAGMGPVGLGIGVALTGGVNALSQVAGNAAQAKLEMKGLSIQNTLNTLGAVVSWVATPFQLLYRATKLLIGSFSGLSLGINKFMQNSIGLMSQMGNPLEQLTGVGYDTYLGTTAIDMATLNRSGTLNSTIEDFAQQSRALYGLGQVNTTRMIAASMLGVFDSMYTPTTDSAGAYYNTANKILRSMQGQSAEQQANTLYWTTNIDSYMAGLVRSAMLLGESDVRNLTDPTRSGMYWIPIGEKEEARFRRTQYEFGSATQQFNFSKMRLGNRLWEAVGKDLYNGFNRLVDAAAGGDWKGVLEEAKNMWGMLKEKVRGVWESITGGKEGGGFWGKFADGFNKASESIISWGAKVAKTIITVWDDIFLAVLEKAQGLIAYLGTVSVKPYKKEDGSYGLKIESIGTAESVDRSSRLYKTGSTIAGRTEYKLREGMDAYHDIASIIYGDKLTSYMQYDARDARYKEGAYWKSTLTGDKVTADAVEWLRSGKDLDLSEYGYYIPGFKDGKVTLQDVEDLTTLFDALSKASIKGDDDWWKVAAWQMGGASRWKLEDYGDRTGLYSLAKTTLKDDVEPFIDTIIDRSAEKLTIRLEISDASGSVKQSMDVNKGGVADSGFLTWLQDLLPDNLRLKVVTH